MSRSRAVAVYLEVGTRRTFACALDWPGWCRSGKTEAAALEALADYAERYAVVTDRAGVRFAVGAAAALDVVERVPGSASTDFGAPGSTAATADAAPLTTTQAKRQAAIVQAAWDLLDEVVATAPAELRKGPRGGGRDRDKVNAHVIEAEASYARMIGVRHKPPAPEDRAAVAALRADVLAVLSRRSDGQPLRNGGWRSRYAARRIAWHVLDHAWEIQDRSTPA